MQIRHIFTNKDACPKFLVDCIWMCSWTILKSMHKFTMFCISLRRCFFGLETRVIIKISTHPCYSINVDWFSLEWSKNIFFLKRKFKMAKRFFAVLELMSDSLTAIHVEPYQCPSHQSILLAKDQPMKFSWKNIENWRSWKMRFF